MAETPRQRWHLYPDVESLYDQAADWIVFCAASAIDRRGRFRIVLAGGSTPRAVYKRLARVCADWTRWHVFFGDERCVPRGDLHRNDAMAAAVWLDHVPIPPEQIHPIPAELGPEHGAKAYTETLAQVSGFDLVLLGLGEDGHVASLFPGADLTAPAAAVAVRAAPKAPAERVSLGAGTLARTGALCFLVTGDGKRQALGRLARGDGALPAAHVQPPGGVDILADAEACRGLLPFP